VNPRIGSRLKHICRLGEEKTVGQGKNLKDGTRKGARNAFPEGTWETGDREWTLAERKTMEGRSLENPRRGSWIPSGIRRQSYASIEKDGVKSRRWFSQTIK